MMPSLNLSDNDDVGYIRIKGRRWRCSDPSIPPNLNQQLVNELMAARRSVAAALKISDDLALKKARSRVQQAKVALGERGPKWWLPMTEDELQQRARMTLLCLLETRPQTSLCPSEIARIIGKDDWRDLMPMVRELAWSYQDQGIVQTTKAGEPVTRGTRGPIRITRGPKYQQDYSIDS